MTGLIQPFASEAAYRNAISTTLAVAQREIRIFDGDLAGMGLENREQIDLLTEFLSANRRRSLHIVVHDDDWLRRHAPRLINLLRLFGHAIAVRRTPEHLRHLTDRWVLADAAHATIRFHADQPRGKQVWNDEREVAPRWQRADDLWQESEPCSPAAVTGL
jgi:hypothetical protein